MKVPLEVAFSPLKGGVYEANGSRGAWWLAGKLIAEWRRGKDGKPVVTWHDERGRASAEEGERT